mmetsp:Transcript_70446/g.165983  ORF Transcript_70446/g.165983 Transcript_70446/m.165983 type:complete len:904 (-) Transcript_70446:3267-5978(-)
MSVLGSFGVVAGLARLGGAVGILGFVGVVFDDALQARQLGAVIQRDQRDALGGATKLTDLGDAGAHQHALVGDQHDLVFRPHQRGCHDAAIALALLDRDHALGTPAVAGVFEDAGALAEAVLGGRQHALRLVFGHQHRNQALVGLQHHAAHTAGGAAHRAHIVFVEANGLATVAEQHHVVVAIGQRRADQVIALIQVNGNDAGLAGVAEVLQRGLLHRAHGRSHEDEVILREAAELAGEWQHDGDLLAGLQREHVDDGLAARRARALRHLPDLEPIDAAAVGEAQDPIVGVGDEELVDPVVIFGGRGLLAAAAAALGAVLAERLALDVAGVRERHDHVGRRDQILGPEFLGVVLDDAAPSTQLGLAEFGLQLGQLVTDDGRHARRRGQDVEQIGDLGHHVLVLANDLVLLQPGQALQAHLQDFSSLRLGQPIEAIRLHAELGLQPFRAVGLTAAFGAGQHLAHQRGIPALGHQGGLGDWRRGRGLDRLDELVDIGQCHRQAFEHVAALAGLAQLENGAAGHHLAAVLQEHHDHVAQIAELGLAVDERDHVHAKAVLQLGLLVEVVQHHLGDFAALELDHHPHAGFVRLVLDVADALDLLFLHQLGDPLEQGLFVHLVGNLVDDDCLPVALVDVLEMHLGAHHHTAAPGAVAVAHAGQAVDDAGGGEVRRRDDLHQLIDRDLRVLQRQQAGVDHLVQVVRRDIRGHTHGDTCSTIHQQIRQTGRQDQGLFVAAVVVGAEIDSFLVDVGQHFMGDFVETNLGVSHCRRVITVNRAKVALAVDQHVAQAEGLGHPDDGVVNRRVTVRVVFTHRLTHSLRTLAVLGVVGVAHLVHRVQHAAMNRLEAVASVRQGAPDDHAHRVIEVGAAHLLLEADRQGFLGELGHAGSILRALRGRNVRVDGSRQF